VGCGGVNRSNTEAVSRAFLSAYYGQDMERAMELASEATCEELQMVIDTWTNEGITPEEAREMAMPVIIEIHGARIDGDTAYCSYTICIDRNDANAMPETLLLVQENKVWKADF
jgi:hypothetical protein